MAQFPGDAAMFVTRCICFDVTFQALKAFADDLRRQGVEVNATVLGEHLRAGTACGMCTMYIEEMLRTGQTRVPVMPMLLKR